MSLTIKNLVIKSVRNQSKLAYLLIFAILFQAGGLTQFSASAHAVESSTLENTTVATAEIITPQQNQILDITSTNITLQSPLNTQVELQVNGQTIESALIGRTEKDTKKQQITQTWYGVPLQMGSNTIVAIIRKDGVTLQTVERSIQVRGTISQLKLSTAETRVPADARSTVTVLGELLDNNGNRSNQEALITLNPSAGEFVEADASSEQPGYQVKASQGQFSASLRSTLQPQTVRIQAKTADLDAFTQVEFETNLRPSLVTGSIDIRWGRRGTDFYGSLRDFLPQDGDYGYQLDAVGSVFATGRVGEWLITGAYNSDRSLNETCDGNSRLFRDQQFCDQNYPVYGDASKTEVLTPSIDSVFFKIERTAPNTIGVDYALWGDYKTDEFATKSQQFSAFNRPLHGFKANYNLGNLQITGLYANNVDGFQRDTIAPDGTSGFYFLSRRLLVSGSENIFLELEELNRPGTVLARQQLSRGSDYEIDYDRGSLLFKQPILRTDIDRNGEVLVRRIVATYQYEGSKSDQSNIYAGRVRYHLSKNPNQESWIAATYLREDLGVRDFELYGADALFSFKQGNLIAEYAHSSNFSDVMGLVSGSAYRLEANAKLTPNLQLRGYFRQADTGFANQTTVSFVPGQTRYGAELTAKVATQTNLRVQYDRERNVGIAPKPLNTLQDLFTPRTEAIPGAPVDNTLTTITAGIQQKIGASDLSLDYVHRDRDDRLSPKASGSSDQIRTRLTVPLAERLTFTAQNETTLSNRPDAVYSDRTGLGLNWEIFQGLNLSLAQQFFHRGQLAGQSLTNLNLNGEYRVGPDTTLNARYGIVGGVDSWTTQGAIGVNQGWTIAPGLRLDANYEHVFGGLLGQTSRGLQYTQAFAVGQNAASLAVGSGSSYGVGLEYTGSKDFQASVRYQHRDSKEGSNTVINAAATGKLSPALTALARYQQAGSANQRIIGLEDTANLKIGLAYRDPNDDRFNALLRYEYRKNPAISPDSILFGNGTGSEDHLFGIEAIYAPSWQWEFYGKYALRRSTTFLADDFVNTSLVSIGQLRATYHFSYSWDLTGEVRWLNQPSTQFNELGLLLEAGYYLTPNLRLAAGYSFGRSADRDFSGSQSAGGVYLGLTLKLSELFDGFGLQKPVAKPVAKPVPQSVSSEPTPVAEIRDQTPDQNAPNADRGSK